VIKNIQNQNYQWEKSTQLLHIGVVRSQSHQNHPAASSRSTLAEKKSMMEQNKQSRKRSIYGYLISIIMLLVLMGGGLWMVFDWIVNKSDQTKKDFRLEIANGYYLMRTNAANCFIATNPFTEYAIPPNIQEMAIVGDFVIGRAEKNSYASDSVEGYFIFNTQTSKSNYGMTKEEWLKQLRQHAITDPALMLPRDAYVRSRGPED
jgi:hypothetical protein